MDRPITYYNRLSLLAFLILGTLVSLQVIWLSKAVKFQEKEIIHQLKSAVGDVGLAVNALDHAAFHGNPDSLQRLSTNEIERVIRESLAEHGIEAPVNFAIFQDSANGILRTNEATFQEELLESEVRTCMSCIVSFWTVPKADSLSGNLKKLDGQALQSHSQFQYYSPVAGLKKQNGETIWLSLHQPHTLSAAIKSMAYLFVLNIILLLVLLALFRHLIRSLSRHKQMAKVKNDFFNNMTHEFKTPISSIRLASTVLRAEANPEKRGSYYDLIERESKSLEQQIDKLLEVSLLENKEIKLEKESVELCALIQNIPKKLHILIENRAGRLHLDCQSDEIMLSGDRHHLLSSLCNLVENSLKHGPPGTNIWVEVRQTSGTIRIVVRDDGPGIRPADQPKIFSRFYRGQAGNLPKSAGFGIGLSYVRNIVEAHGGTIHLNPEYRDGTEFILQF